VRAGITIVPNRRVNAKSKNIPIRSALHRVLIGPDRFDLSNPHGNFAFIVGGDTGIQGMEKVVVNMTLGEKSVLTIPA
jgi:hypothetical protein